ncbi:hypothetical protein Hdeb2414_s0008g00291121 [Helianthus debilis subsp. tardiflorus]
MRSECSVFQKEVTNRRDSHNSADGFARTTKIKLLQTAQFHKRNQTLTLTRSWNYLKHLMRKMLVNTRGSSSQLP